MSDKQCVYKTTLKTVYGLTDSMIRDLGEPDKQVPNPHYRSGPPSSLYVIERVEHWIEAHGDRVEKARKARSKRSASARKVADRKYADTLAWAEVVAIDVKLPVDVRQRAADHYARRSDWYGDSASWYTDSAVIAYARHQCSNYHELLATLAGRVGCTDAYHVIKRRVNEIVQAALDGMA